MRLKLLRTLGRNLPDVTEEDGEVDLEGLTKAPQPQEGHVVEASEDTGNWLKKHGLAEETEEEVTPAREDAAKSRKGKAPAHEAQQQAGQAKFPARTRVEVTDRQHPDHRSKGVVESVSAVPGGGELYTIRKDDGGTIRATDSQIRKA